MTATPGLDAYLATREDRCAGCGMHPELQGCACLANATQRATIAAVTSSTPDTVKARIDAAIMRHARTGRPFSANAIRAELDGVKGAQIGPRFAAMGKAGVLEQVDLEQSTDPGTRHRIGVWRLTTSNRKAA